MGNPLGELTFSMSEGIVSCVNRAINVDGTPFNICLLYTSLDVHGVALHSVILFKVDLAGLAVVIDRQVT